MQANGHFFTRRTKIHELHQEDPVSGVVNLLDVFLLIGVGFLVAALSGFGLSELLTKGDMTIVKNPNGPNTEIYRKQGDKIDQYKLAGKAGVGGNKIGEVYQLKDGSVIWTALPGAEGK